MKKLSLTILATTLLLTGLASCSSGDSGSSSTSSSSAGSSSSGTTATTPAATESEGDGTVWSDIVKIGATPSPHAEILEIAVPLMEEQGYILEIVDYVDYVQPNLALDQGDLDGNYFQHQPYLDQFNEENGTDLVSVSSVHYEPFGVYPGQSDDLENISEGAKIAVPNDASNEARALLLLQAEGLISLVEGTGISATINDIEGNYFDIEILELEAAQIPRSLPDVDFAVINGNYAVEAGLNVVEDALAQEDASSLAATTYGNILVVKAGNEENPGIEALVEILEGEVIRDFITETYGGAVLSLHE